MVESAPSSVDLLDFQFKLHSKLKVFDYVDDSKFHSSASLVAAASRFALIFIGSPNGTLEIVQTKSIEGSSVAKIESTNYAKRSVPLPSVPTHLALNCDQTLLTVVITNDGCASAIIYSVQSFLSQNIAVVREIRVSVTPGVCVLETCWNPAMPTVYTACKSDGSLGVYNLTETGVEINEIPAMARATCFCWSPKGKQIVVGSANGTLTQYKPDLKAVKAIPAPVLGGSGHFSVINVFWVTNYQFVAIYKDASDANTRPSILIVNAPKTGAISYINYDDICYSYGTLRPSQYYMIHQPIWGVLLVASANSMEVGVLGICQSGEPALWQQWNQIDAARAELPLSASHQETFPIGFALDTGINLQLPWGENQSLPPMPMIHLLSHHGVLCSFNVINIRQGAATICTPPEPVPDQSGLAQFVIPVQAPPVQQAQPVPQQALPIQQAQPTPQQVLPVQQEAPPVQLEAPPIQQQVPLSVAPNIATPIQSQTPPQNTQSMFKLDTTTSGMPFSSPSLVPTVSATVMPKPTSQPSTLFGGTSTPTLFGTTPNFGAALPTATSSIEGLNFKLPTIASTGSMFGGVNTTPKLTSPSFGAITPNNTTPINFSSPATPVATLSGQNPQFTASLFGSSSASPPVKTQNFGFGSLTPKTTATPVPISTPPGNITPTSQLSMTRPIGQPLLATPKEVTPKPSKIEPIHDSTKKVEDKSVNEQVLQNLIKEEVKTFRSELKELFFRCKNIQLNVGTEEEKSFLVLTTDSLLEFYKELQEITDSQVSEVHYLKQALMQSFAWYEDTKSRHRRYTDPNFASLLQSQELDPISEKQLADIQHLIYYIEAQLKQVDGFLDNQWADFQDSCKKHIKGKLQIPTLEPIYQSLVRQNAILDKQRYFLKDIGARIKSRNNKAASYPHVLNLSNLVVRKDNIQLDEELRKLKIDNGDLFTVRYNRIVANQRKFTDGKQEKLCAFFSNRNVAHIAPRKPKFMNSILMNTPSKSSFTSPPAQRSLGQAFELIAEIEDSPLNNSAEANISASNLFSFSLLDGVSKSKTQPTDKLNLIQVKLKTPEATQAFKPTIMSPKSQTNFFGSKPTTATGPVFNFTAPQTTIPQNKPQIFTSNTLQPAASTNFLFGSNITITSVSSAVVDKPKPVPNFSFSISSIAPPVSKISEVKTVESPVAPKVAAIKIPATQSDDKILIKKAPAAEPIQFGSSTPDVKKQPFTFNVPKAIVSDAKPVEESKVGLDVTSTGFSFGSALSLGQQSTPKPKTVATALNFGQALTPSITPVGTSSQVVPKPTFGLSKAVVTSTPVAGLQVATQSVSTPISSKVETVSVASSPSIFSGVSTSTIASVFAEPTLSTPGNTLFGGTSTTSTLFGTKSQSASVFGAKPDTTPDTPTTSLNFVQPIPKSSEQITPTTVTDFNSALVTPKSISPQITPSTTSFNFAQTTPENTGNTATGFNFLQSSTPVISELPKTSMFGNATTPNVGLSSSTASTVAFSFLQPAAKTTEATTGFSALQSTPTTSIFGGASSNTPPNTGLASTTTTGFSFLQPAVNTSSASEAASIPKISSVFSLATGVKATEANPINFGTKPQDPTSFGFDALAVSSPENKFSFGNLTVSALSPNASTTTTVTSINTGSFSFASPASSTATTASFGFGGNIFAKPATTTTASFMGQPICSPSTFSQNTTPAFGQAIGNIFAQKPNISTANVGSIFGQSGGSVFGGAGNATVTTASLFGQAASSPFGSTPAAQTSTTGSIFGQSNPGFGTATTTSGSIFGQSTFGTPAATSASTNFSFTQNTNTASANFGNSGGSIFGAKPSFGQPAAFGQPSAFGAQAQQSFGSSPAFGTPSTPQQSAGGFGDVAASGGGGFGSSSPFGAKAAFGSPPAFGQSAFGAPPAFGSSPSFGNPQRLFGSSPPQGGMPPPFGAQENSTFANLANQSTLGFGSLAQNQPTAAPPPQAPQFSGGSQFSSWR